MILRKRKQSPSETGKKPTPKKSKCHVDDPPTGFEKLLRHVSDALLGFLSEEEQRLLGTCSAETRVFTTDHINRTLWQRADLPTKPFSGARYVDRLFEHDSIHRDTRKACFVNYCRETLKRITHANNPNLTHLTLNASNEPAIHACWPYHTRFHELINLRTLRLKRGRVIVSDETLPANLTNLSIFLNGSTDSFIVERIPASLQRLKIKEGTTESDASVRFRQPFSHNPCSLVGVLTGSTLLTKVVVHVRGFDQDLAGLPTSLEKLSVLCRRLPQHAVDDLPSRLKKLVVRAKGVVVRGNKLPRSLIYLYTWVRTIESLDRLPDTIKTLCLMGHFDSPLEGLPDGIATLWIGARFNQPITQPLPRCLNVFRVCGSSKRYGLKQHLPEDKMAKKYYSLKRRGMPVEFCRFDQPILPDILPQGLRVLALGDGYNHPLSHSFEDTIFVPRGVPFPHDTERCEVLSSEPVGDLEQITVRHTVPVIPLSLEELWIEGFAMISILPPIDWRIKTFVVEFPEKIESIYEFESLRVLAVPSCGEIMGDLLPKTIERISVYNLRLSTENATMEHAINLVSIQTTHYNVPNHKLPACLTELRVTRPNPIHFSVHGLPPRLESLWLGSAFGEVPFLVPKSLKTLYIHEWRGSFRGLPDDLEKLHVRVFNPPPKTEFGTLPRRLKCFLLDNNLGTSTRIEVPDTLENTQITVGSHGVFLQRIPFSVKTLSIFGYGSNARAYRDVAQQLSYAESIRELILTLWSAERLLPLLAEKTKYGLFRVQILCERLKIEKAKKLVATIRFPRHCIFVYKPNQL
jgi:hypothetical protein